MIDMHVIINPVNVCGLFYMAILGKTNMMGILVETQFNG